MSILFCEGSAGSPDARLLKKLLRGIDIAPAGSKHGMGERIMARREHLGPSTVFGLLDGDFVEEWSTPRDVPKPWERRDGGTPIRFGWRWERKEIENYLLEPAVVVKSIPEERLSLDRYRDILQRAAGAIADYQAARTALSNSRRRVSPLPSAFGERHGKDNYPYPTSLTEADCRSQIASCVAEHQSTQSMTAAEVLCRFDALLPEFREEGRRRLSYLHAFSGKDLFWAMDSDLKTLGIKGMNGAMAFREQILLGIERTGEDISTWLPEWRALREAVSAIP